MRSFRALAYAVVLSFSMSLPLFASSTERVSLSSGDGEASAESRGSSISSDGRYIAFESDAPDLVANDTNGLTDVFVRDRLAGETQRVSVSSAGAEGNNESRCPAISANGRYITFCSLASNLVVNDTNRNWDAFVHDMETGQTEVVSVNGDGVQGNGATDGSSISADGRYVAFSSAAQNLVPDKTSSEHDIFLHDRQTGQTERVSVSSDGDEANGESWLDAARCVISADGRFVTYTSVASNLVPGDTNAAIDIFLRDRLAGETQRVSVNSAGAEANNESRSPAISADGRHVAFASYASNLVADDVGLDWRVYVHDRETGQTERVSVATDGSEPSLPSGLPCISADGRFVAFQSTASNLVPGDTNGWVDVFVRDREAGVTVRVSVAGDGGEGNGHCYYHYISGDGRFVTFSSAATNLVTGDTNGVIDIFVRDRQTFSDVAVTHWAFYQIGACAQSGVVSGYQDGTYQPGTEVTRDQMAVYIARALAGDDENVPDPSGEPTFPDVRAGDWGYKHIEYAAAQNVVAGYEDGLYHPEYQVTRDQMAVYVARALVAPEGDEGLVGYVPADPRDFPDVPATGYGDSGTDPYWAYKHIEYCVENGVVQGYEDGYYHPADPVTRDQMAVYIARAFGLL
jgi:Tol biopolymer transport system component